MTSQKERNPFIINDDDIQQEHLPLVDDDDDVEQEYNPFDNDHDVDDSHDDDRDGNGHHDNCLSDEGCNDDGLSDNGHSDDGFHGFEGHSRQYLRGASEDPGRRSPTEEALIRRPRSGRHPVQQSNRRDPESEDIRMQQASSPFLAQVQDDDRAASLCGEEFEILRRPSHLAVGDGGTLPATSGHSKRGHPRTPSPQAEGSSARPVHPLRGLKSPTRAVAPPRFQRSVSSSQLLQQRSHLNSPKRQQARSNFSDYRQVQPGPSSTSSRTSTSTGRHYDEQGVQPSEASLARGPRTPSTPSRTRPVDQFFRKGPLSAPVFVDEKTLALAERRRNLQDSHRAPDAWYQFYELPLGTIPTPEQCASAPPSQAALARVPYTKSSRKAKVLGHFYTSQILAGFYVCQQQLEDGTICGQSYTTRGGGTSRPRHLLSCHADEHAALAEFREYQCLLAGVEVPVVDEDEDEEEVPFTPKKSKYEIVREDIVHGNMRKPMPQEISVFHRCLLELIASGGVPFNFIQSAGFKKLIALLNMNYSVPSTAFLQRLLDEEVTKSRIEIKNYLSMSVVRGSITADGWTSKDSRKFLGATYHFLTKSYKPATLVIGLEPITGSQTSEVLLEGIKKIVHSWDLHDNRLVCGTTDQGSNIKRAMSLFRDTDILHWLPCTAHKIQLCINKGLDAAPEAMAVIEKCHRLSTFFRNSTVAQDVLKKVQGNLQLDPVKLLAVTKVRWNSYYDMAARVLRIANAIPESYQIMMDGSKDQKAKGRELGDLLLDNQERLALQEIVTLMGPAAKLTHWAGGGKAITISQMYFRVYALIPPENSNISPAARLLHSKLEEFIRTSWPLHGIPDVMLITMFFNPALLASGILMRTTLEDGTSLQQKAVNLVKDALVSFKKQDLAMEHKQQQKELRELTLKARQPFVEKQQPDHDEEAYKFLAVYIIMKYTKPILARPGEFLEYMDTPEDYWKKEETSGLADLSRMARAYLSAQATSTAAERLFSKAGLVLSNDRTKLLDRNFQNIIFYDSFLKLRNLLEKEDIN